MAFGHAINDVYSGTVAFTIFFVVSSLHQPPWYQGLLTLSWYATSAIAQPLVGAFTDKHGRWWFMPTGVLTIVIAMSFAALAPNVWLLAIPVVLSGCGAAIMHPEAGKYAAMLSGSRRSRGISIFQMGGAIGFAFGPIIITALLAHFGSVGCLFMLPPGLLACAYVYFAMHGADALAVSAHAARKKREGAAVNRIDKLGIGLVVTSTTIRFLTTTSFMTFLPNLLVARGETLAQAGQIVSGFLLFGLIGLYVGGNLSDRFGSVLVSVLAMCLCVPCFAAFILLPMPLAIAFLFLANILLTVQNSPAVVIVQSMLPKNLGMALGLINGVAFGAGSLLVTLVGFAVTRFGTGPTLLYVGLLPLIGASAYLGVRRRLPNVLRQTVPAAVAG